MSSDNYILVDDIKVKDMPKDLCKTYKCTIGDQFIEVRMSTPFKHNRVPKTMTVLHNHTKDSQKIDIKELAIHVVNRIKSNLIGYLRLNGSKPISQKVFDSLDSIYDNIIAAEDLSKEKLYSIFEEYRFRIDDISIIKFRD